MNTSAAARVAAVAVVGVAYVLGSHWLMTTAHDSPWNVVGVLSPMLAVIGVGAWRGGQRGLALGAAALIAALCGQALLGVHISAQALYVAQHMGINGFLAVLFGATLRAGHKPFITGLAERVHTVFTPEMAAYTRKATLAWTLYFVGMAAVSLLLYLLAPFDVWALFANLLTPLAVALMFGAEYLLRYWLHPEFERASVADAVRAYMQAGQAPVKPDSAR
jgi:uncharacterized membrane protein